MYGGSRFADALASYSSCARTSPAACRLLPVPWPDSNVATTQAPGLLTILDSCSTPQVQAIVLDIMLISASRKPVLLTYYLW